MSFLFKKKKKTISTASGPDRPPMSDATKRLYYTAEFKCLGDMTKDGMMSIEEFYRLMMLLGYPKGRDGSKRLWKSRGLSEGGKMTQDQYITMMFDPKVESKTNLWRNLFAEFDHDGSSFVTKGEILQGFENMGLPVTDATKAKIDTMDVNRDNRISYIEFLKGQLRQ